MTTQQAPYPRALARFPVIRQSVLATFDACALESHFDMSYRRGWSTHPQGRGRIFHRFAGRALAVMREMREQRIEVDVALTILDEVLAQGDADRECPDCGSEKILPGLTKRMERTCGSCGALFETEFVNVPRKHVADLVWVVKKWAKDNTFDYHFIIDVEARLSSPVYYSVEGIGIDRMLTGQQDVLLVDPQDGNHAIVIDWKDTWALPPASEISEEGYFQQRFYAWLVMKNYRKVERVTLREFYVRFSQVREATLWRHDLDQLEDELSALVRKFDRAYEEQVYVPTPGRHCFAAETRFLTSRGVRRLGDLAGEPVRVLNRHGQWEDATVRSFGVQPLARVTFDDGSIIRATPDHRWWTLKQVRGSWQQTDERITTVELDRAPLLHRRAPEITEANAAEFVDGARHGFVYGDGWRRGDRDTSVAVLMPHDHELGSYFLPKRTHWKQQRGRYGDFVRGFVYGLPWSYKELPRETSEVYARGFIAGLIAADGSVDSGGVVIHQEGLAQARAIAELAWLGGAAVSSIRVDQTRPTALSPVGTITREMCRIRLKPATAPLIKADHRARLRPRHQMRKPYVRVVSIEPDGAEEVYCVVAPGSESFTLASGIVTSNCGWCIRPQKCPVPVFAREEGRITDERRARQVAGQLVVAKRVVKRSEKDLRAWVENNGPVEVKDAKGRRQYGFVTSDRTDRPTREQIEDALLRSGGTLSADDVEALYRQTTSTRFVDYAPEREEGEDKPLIDSLARSIERAAKRKGIA